MASESINDVLNAGMTAEQIGKVLHKSDMKALSEAAIADACEESFNDMWHCQTAWQLRSHVDQQIAKTIHSYGFHSAGEWVSERDADLLDGLLKASKRCLAHFDKIRPADKEPSSMVEDLRKAIRAMETNQ